MPPSLKQALTMRLYQSKNENLSFKSTKGNAQRIIGPLISGWLRGSSTISADLVPGGSDWLYYDVPTGTGHIDARVHFRNYETGACYYIHFLGIVRLDEKIEKILHWSDEDQTTKSEDHYNVVTPIVEVSEQGDKWMERTVLVGYGRYVVEDVDGEGRQAVGYQIYEVAQE